MADPVWGSFEPPADENRRLRALLRRWVRMEKEVLPPDELARLCDDTRRMLGETEPRGQIVTPSAAD